MFKLYISKEISGVEGPLQFLTAEAMYAYYISLRLSQTRHIHVYIFAEDGKFITMPQLEAMIKNV